MKSLPAPPKTSVTSWPTMMKSLPAPPKRMSMPAPLLITSLPSSPRSSRRRRTVPWSVMMSSPSPPMTWSDSVAAVEVVVAAVAPEGVHAAVADQMMSLPSVPPSTTCSPPS